ncbi:hypothetical protein Tco_0722693 [Tanacetum coccineum]
MTGSKAYLLDYEDYNGGASLNRKSTTELVSAASLVNTARPTLSTARPTLSTTRLGKFGAARQIWCCQANLVLPGKFVAVRQIWCCQANLMLSGKFGAARQIWCCQGKVCVVCYRYYC